MAAKHGSITFRWWGQACFSIADEEGLQVLTDPFPADFGYPEIGAEPHVCLISHEHHDHSAVENVKGDPAVVRGVGEHQLAGLQFTGVSTFHDDKQGAQRGPNTVFVWQMNGITIAHMGDLGHILTDQQANEIGSVDVVMIPAGGNYTINAEQAVEVARQIHAKIVLPMHVQTAAVPNFPVDTIDSFISAAPDTWQIEQPDATSLTIGPEDLEHDRVRAVVLKYQ